MLSGSTVLAQSRPAQSPRASSSQGAAARPGGARVALPRPAAAAPAPASYVIGPDDVLGITVLRHPEFSVDQAVVPGTGLVALPVVGTVQATGKTVAQLDAEITRKLKVRLLKPEVAVSIVKPAPRPLYVVGQVRNPGVLEFKNGWRITQALASSGGLTIDSDLAAVVVSRGQKTVADVPLLPILRNPSGAQNISLNIGDTLRFYERVVKINVAGAVQKPGIYAVPRGNGVVEAIGLAGGPTDTASLTRATLRRADGSVTRVNLYQALREGDPKQNLALREGDVLSVPEYKDRVSVLGSVKTPGYYGLEDGRSLRVADVVARAGGPADGAALTRVTLRHANGKTENLNLYRLLVLGQNEDNVTLAPNDVLTIPESRGIAVLGEVQSPRTYKIEEGAQPRLSDVIAQAGGLRVKTELARISVQRTLPNGRAVTLSVDPIGLLDLSNPAQNTFMQDGDIVSVSAVKLAAIAVSGQVKTPGVYDLQEGDGLSNLIARAGGPTEDAAVSRVVISSRGGSTRTVDAVSLLATGQGANIALQDGDTVTVPRSAARVLVVGSVNRPGTYALTEDRPLTVGDALSLAGGTASRVRTVRLLRQTPQGAQPQDLQLDRPDKNGRLAISQVVQPNDVIYVPEGKPSQDTLSRVNGFLPALSTALFLFR